MQRLGNSLPKIQRQQEAEDALYEQLIIHPNVQQFLSRYPELTKVQLMDNLPALAELVRYHQHCEHCAGIHECPHPAKGYRATLDQDGCRLQTTLYPCHYKKNQLDKTQFIQAISLPKQILSADFLDWQAPSDRIQIMPALEHCAAIRNAKDHRGLYIQGGFGVGKTHLLGAIAKSLSESGLHSLLVFWPEFTREIKSDFSVLDQKLERLKTIDVLMIDDIGAENNTSFVRDEVLLPILNYRMMFQKPTFFSSNLPVESLADHFKISQRGDDEPIKAMRVLERIHSLTIPLTLSGPNRRR
ncbi:MAG: primosomal protein DnaI [Culicoidibacterales bacterium]